MSSFLQLYKQQLTPMARLTQQAQSPTAEMSEPEADSADPVASGLAEAPAPSAALEGATSTEMSPDQLKGMQDMIKARAEARKAASLEYQAKDMPVVGPKS